jgi:hypothetical protein
MDLEQLLQPRTDAGVLAQAIIVSVLVAVGTWRVRHDPELRRLGLGLGVFTAGLFVLRAMH